jgi:hypothetical protein
MEDAASASSSILIALCGGVALLSAAVGYVAERIAPVDKTEEEEEDKPKEPPTIEKRVDTLETVVYNRNPRGAVAVPLPPPEPPAEPPKAVAVPLSPDMLSLSPPPPQAPPMLGGGGVVERTPVKIRIVG